MSLILILLRNFVNDCKALDNNALAHALSMIASGL